MMRFLLLIIALTLFGRGNPGLGQENDFGFGAPQQNQDLSGLSDPLKQDPGKQDPQSGGGLEQNPFNSQFGGFNAGSQQARADFEAKFQLRKGSRQGTLMITGKPDPLSHSHIYSQRTDLEFQTPTVFTVKKNSKFKVTGKFSPDVDFERVEKDVNGQIWVTEESAEDVTWSAPLTIAEGVDAESLTIDIQVDGQVCNEQGCMPYDGMIVTAKFAGYIEAGPYRDASRSGSNKVEWSGSISSSTVKPGDSFEIVLTAKVDEHWHLYGQDLLEIDGYSPTIILLSRNGIVTATDFKASVAPSEKQVGDSVQFHHEGTVTFSSTVTVDPDTEPGSALLQGKIGFQTCNEDGICKTPSVADFQVTINIGKTTDSESIPVTISGSKSTYDQVLKMYKERMTDEKEPFVLATFLWYCGLSFLAGLILNIMPCVLPVIGLKMMSFVEQAGESRGRIFALNFAFSLGLMTVFWLLGFLVVVMDFGWGDLLNKGLTGVLIASGIVFAFGLSMMGVWEIPIPGFATSSHANKLAEKEGLAGAFIKGILTTILATPCVGPMLIPAMTFAVSQSQFVGFAIFTMLGVGMAFPFLMVAVFPAAINVLPKPGAWMDTFKQVMGFVLLGTVLFLLSTFAKPDPEKTPYVLPTLWMLLVISIGCWWIGRTSIAAEKIKLAKAYAIGILIIGLGTWGGFRYLGPPQWELDWKPYSNTYLAELQKEGKPVFIDFTGPG